VEEGASVATPAQVDVWVGLDVGKGEHFADVLDDDASSDELLARLRVLNGFDIDLAAGATRLAMLRTGQPGEPARPAPSLAEGA
jgi:hypothetical protein